MAILLDERKGISSGLLYVLAAIAGITVANLYYNQPLLDMIRVDLEASEMEANHIALFTQLGYALGLLFIIPLADLYSRKRIVLVNFSVLTLSLLGIAMAGKVYWLQFFSLLTGICSVIPQIFVPFAAQYSRPEEKGKNVGMVVSGLLTGILLSRVVSGYVGDWLGWREMYYIASGLMVLSAIVILSVLPDTAVNYGGTYVSLMRSLMTIIRDYPALRVYAARAALAFGSFMGFWTNLAFKMAQEPFNAGSDVVGALGLCGVVGALSASFVGRYVKWFGVRRFNYLGVALQILAWSLFWFGGESYAGLIAGILIIDIGMQCVQLSNQTVMFDLCPTASNRINTIFMTSYFLGGALGTFLSGTAWSLWGWTGVVVVGLSLALGSGLITVCTRR